MVIDVMRPLRVHLRNRTIDLQPGYPAELDDDDAIRLLAKKPDAVRWVFQAGDWVEWRSPALPKQQGEVLAVHPDRTFEVFHPLTEAVCRLPGAWVLRVLRNPMNRAGRPHE